MRKRTTKTLISLVLWLGLAMGAQAVNTTSTLVSGNLDLYSDRSTGAAAMDVTLSSGSVKQIHEVRVKLSAATVTDTLTLTLDSNYGSTYDVVLNSQDLTGLTSYVWRPAQPVYIGESDDIECALTNGAAVTWTIEIIWRKPRQ